MNSIDQQKLGPQLDTELEDVVSAWLRNFEDALSSCNKAAIASLFEEEGNWRDVLAFTWHLTPKVGAIAIAEALVARQPAVKARAFGISPQRTRPRLVNRLGRECIWRRYLARPVRVL